MGEGARRGARGAGERVGRLVPRVVGYRKGKLVELNMKGISRKIVLDACDKNT